MEVIDLSLSGLKLIKPDIYTDERGFFLETFQVERYWEQGLYSDHFIQDNHSRSIKNVLRGLHYQDGQQKLVRCTNGIIWDVAVDIRVNSPTFGQHYGLYLDSTDALQLFIPSGFAHAFVAISDIVDVEYKVTSHYNSAKQGSIKWNDNDLNIPWKNKFCDIESIILSDKDKQAQSFAEYKANLK